jgi:uncharacterized membrane protein
MERREKYSKVIIVFFILFSIWILLQFLAPLFLPADSVDDLSGIVAVSDNEKNIEEMSFPWGVVYSAGDRLCHQKAERSFFINGNQMAFCSRCTALWLGLAIGLGFMVFYQIELDEKFLYLLVLGFLPIAVDGIGQLFGFWESINSIRMITGLLAGVTCGVTISIIVDELKTIPYLKNQKLKK